MATVKTAISLDQRLFQEINAIARRRRIPRSQLIAQAVREFLRARSRDDLTERIDRSEAAIAETAQERRAKSASVENLRELLEGSW